MKDSKLSFKLKIVSKDKTDVGKVVSATTEIHPKDPKSQKKKEEFFKPVQEDLGDMPWLIEWEDDGDPIIKINTRLVDKFGDWRDVTLQALFLPAILRDLLTGTISRINQIDDIDDKDSLIYKLIHFCKDRLGQSFPEEEIIDDDCINTLWLDWVEESIREFCCTRWRHNQTLMEQMLEEVNNG